MTVARFTYNCRFSPSGEEKRENTDSGQRRKDEDGGMELTGGSDLL